MKLLRSRIHLLWLCSVGVGACVSASTSLPRTTPRANVQAEASSSRMERSRWEESSTLAEAVRVAAPAALQTLSTEAFVESASQQAKKPPTPIQPPPPPLRERPEWKEWVSRYEAMGKSILRAGRRIRYRQRQIGKRCRLDKASRAACRYHNRSARIFSINYRTSPRNYRGYVTFSRKRKKKIPRSLMKWYRRVDRKRYLPRGRCYLDKGMLANCMTFALCAVKEGVRDYKEDDQPGFAYPTWGIVQYWTTRVFHKHLHDYVKQDKSRIGIRTLQTYMDDWSLEQKLAVSRKLLLDMYESYRNIVRRKAKPSNYIIYDKAFCSNIVVDMGRLNRALPGDLFGMVHYRKRRKNTKIRLHFQHWGLIAEPTKNRVFHIQTPGGLWGRTYRKWGIQYGSYSTPETEWKWIRRRRRYRKKVMSIHRVNLHYYTQAREQNVNLYSSKDPHFCRHWIENYADIYFTNMANPSNDETTE